MIPGVVTMLAMLAVPEGQTAQTYAGPDPVVAPGPDGLPEIASNFDRVTEIEHDPSP